MPKVEYLVGFAKILLHVQPKPSAREKCVFVQTTVRGEREIEL